MALTDKELQEEQLHLKKAYGLIIDETELLSGNIKDKYTFLRKN